MLFAKNARRGAIVTGAAAAAVALLTGSAHANVSTFAGTAVTTCDRPEAPSVGTATGNGTCETTGTASTCVTSVDTPEGGVVSTCSGNLTAATSLFFILHRASEQGAVNAYCLGSGSGIFRYRPTPSSSIIEVPVTVSVKGQTAEFGGVAALGLNTAVVSGTYTAACGGYGSYAGQVL